MQLLIFSTLILYALTFFLVILYHIIKKDIFEFFSKSAMVIGLLFHTIALSIRTYESGHAPMLAMYETLLFYSWSTVLVSTIVIFRYSERFTELITVPVAVLTMIFAQLNETSSKPLTLILKTRWFESHVISSFAAYALFTLAFAGAVLYLISEAKSGGGIPNKSIRGQAPLPYKDFQDIAHRSILWGFCFFSASMFAGAVWAYLAWGAYWLWEPKVVWSFIVWFYYAGAMHAYYIKQWRGKGLAIATVVGFFVVLFTYLGVSMLMKSSHSF
ncbi:MAG: cytochrome c biogenesis protein CcsA [Deltaproteobacteria bacterium]|nr:cytochrome c biogenesis protein CcsA [Deltaproteobacteria bacterium]